MQVARQNLLLIGVAFGLVVFAAFFMMYELWQRQKSEPQQEIGEDEEEEEKALIDPSSKGALLTFKNITVPGRVEGVSGGNWGGFECLLDVYHFHLFFFFQKTFYRPR